MESLQISQFLLSDLSHRLQVKAFPFFAPQLRLQILDLCLRAFFRLSQIFLQSLRLGLKQSYAGLTIPAMRLNEMET